MERTQLWTRLQWWENGVLWPSEKTLLKLLEFLYSRLYYHMFRIDCDVIPNQRMLFTRCALHGLIYLWDLKSTTKSLTEDTKKDKIIEKEARQKIGIKTRQILTQHNNTKISFRWPCCPTSSGAIQITFTWISAVTRWPFYVVVISTSKPAQCSFYRIFVEIFNVCF